MSGGKNIVGEGLLRAVVVLSFLAMGVAAYLIYLHYEPSASTVCEINAQFNCDIVNKSQWSYVDLGGFELPVAIPGFLYYLAAFILSVGLMRDWEYHRIHHWLTTKRVLRILTLMTVLGVIFTLHLTYIEAFVLYTYCLFCVIQQIIILGIMGLLVAAEVKHIRASRQKAELF
jgi:vitamin-K-epoxide reductase (warfarin-sensitive)